MGGMSARSSLVVIVAAAAATLIGCHHPAPVGTVGNGGGDQSSGFLVWTAGAEGGPERTRWLDGDGQLVGQADGRLVAHGGHLWRIQLDKRDISGEGCEQGDGDTQPGTGTAVDLSLVPLDGGQPIELVTGPGSTEDAGEYNASVDVVAQLGRYLVIEENVYIYACGVHGDGTSLSYLFDLATKARAPEMVTMADLDHLTAAARAALADHEVEPDAELGLGESRPVWRAGKLAMRHLVYADTCYACSDGDWSSYTAAVWLDDPAVPRPFTDEAAALPAPVAAALDGLDQGGSFGISWGPPGDGWRSRFAK